MSLIIIGGLDGSGKSTALDKIAAKDIPKVEILRTPYLEPAKFSEREDLLRLATFINDLSDMADSRSVPSPNDPTAERRSGPGCSRHAAQRTSGRAFSDVG